MDLKSWMDKKEMTIDETAKKIGVSIYAVKKWLRGERIPRPRMQFRIRKMTAGAVCAEDWAFKE